MTKEQIELNKEVVEFLKETINTHAWLKHKKIPWEEWLKERGENFLELLRNRKILAEPYL